MGVEDKSKQRSNVRLLKGRWLNGMTLGKEKESYQSQQCYSMQCNGTRKGESPERRSIPFLWSSGTIVHCSIREF